MAKSRLIVAIVSMLISSLSMSAQSHPGAEDLHTLAVNRAEFAPFQSLDAGVQSQPGFTRQLLQVQWRAGDPIDLYVVRPANTVKTPAVIFLYSWPDGTDRFQSDAWCRNITSHGFAAVGFVSALTGQRYHDRPWKETFVSELPEALVKSTHDVQLLLDYLGTRSDLDSNRVGIFGQGSGGTIALLASSVDGRLKATDVIDPWGDWADWFRSSSIIPDSERQHFADSAFLKSVAPYDPVTILPTMRGKSLRLQQTAFNPSTPEATRDALRRALPAEATHTLYANEEEYRSRAMENSRILDWMHARLVAP